MSTTVVVADERPVVRVGLLSWLQTTGLTAVAECGTNEEVERATRELRPAVLLLGVRLPAHGGLDCLKRMRNAGDRTPTLLVADHDNPTHAARGQALGAAGLLAVGCTREELAAAVAKAAAGEACWSAGDRRRFGRATPEDAASLPRGLTVRESQVLKQLAFGLSNKEIAAAMGISYETVKEHVQHILRKLGVADRTQAAVWAVRNGFD